MYTDKIFNLAFHRAAKFLLAGIAALSFTSCNPLSKGSTIDTNFHPGILGVASSIQSQIKISDVTLPADGIATATITVILQDSTGVPVSGKSVSLSSSRGSLDNISPPTRTSNELGVVIFLVKSSNAGASVYGAKDVTDSVTISGTVQVIYSPLVSVSLSQVIASPTSVAANGSSLSTITVTLLKPSGLPLPGKIVTLDSSRLASDTISAASGVSDAAGVVTFTVSSTVAGGAVFTATDVTDAAVLLMTATVTFNSGPVSIAKSTVVASPTSVADDGVATSLITITLKDTNLNPVSGKSVTLASSRVADLISSASGSSTNLGVVTFTVKSPLVGTSIFTATDSTDTLVITQTASVNFTLGAVSAAVSTFVSSDVYVPNDGATSSTLTVTLLDSTSNPVAGKTVSVTSSRNATDTISPATALSNSSGVAIFNVTSVTLGAATLTAHDTTDSKNLIQTRIVTFVGPADHLVLISGNNQTKQVGGALAAMKVQVVDKLGNPYISGMNLTIDNTIGLDNPVLGSPTVTSDASGYASFLTSIGWGSNFDQWRIFSATGLPDLAASGNKSLIFKSQATTLGDGTLASVSTIGMSWLAGLAVIDYNHDGSQDIIGTNVSAGYYTFQGNNTGSFTNLGNSPVGSGPNGIVVGDFNQDGYPDIATLDVGSDRVSIMLGNAGGGLSAPVGYGVASVQCGVDPLCGLIAVDVNGDGKLDLIVASQNANLIGILLGNGDGTFAAATYLDTVGGSPVAIAAADFNGDGKIDLAVANYSSNKVGIFLGNGNGTFRAQVIYSVGTQPSAIVIGDFRGNGKIDIAVANEGTNDMSILLGNGDGTFQAETRYGAQANPIAIVAGDFKHDGRLDLVVANYNSNTLSVFMSNNDGTFQNQVNYATLANPLGMVVGDFNKDGKLDLAVACISGGLQVFLGN